MTREIGSEYHRMSIEDGNGLLFPLSGSMVFSGRTAIETVLHQLPYAHTALLPSYCCDSMVIPFLKTNLDVSYYSVSWEDGLKIEIDKTADIILWCDYFGFLNDMPDFDGIVIEDITHSFLSSKQFHKQSDYLVASLRKWEPILCGGYVSVNTDYPMPPEEFLTKKLYAMEQKSEYLKSLDIGLKEMFLKLFKDSNQWLANNYSGLSIDDYSLNYIKHINVEKQRSIRRRNASVLYDGLSGFVQFMFPEDSMDCPLFVPIILNGNRDQVRQYLIDNDIYCPVHWPYPEVNCESNLYDLELSLICDQRYNEKDMERIVSVVKEAL